MSNAHVTIFHLSTYHKINYCTTYSPKLRLLFRFVTDGCTSGSSWTISAECRFRALAVVGEDRSSCFEQVFFLMHEEHKDLLPLWAHLHTTFPHFSCWYALYDITVYVSLDVRVFWTRDAWLRWLRETYADVSLSQAMNTEPANNTSTTSIESAMQFSCNNWQNPTTFHWAELNINF
jgi:hypothetical protein